MNILVVGGGGRESALVKALQKSPRAGKIFVLPGNGGMEGVTCISADPKNISQVVTAARENNIDYAVVAPDDPLALGAVDALEEAGIRAFGPRKAAAKIESSKVFAKNLMKKYGIPTAAFEVFSDESEAMAYIERTPLPLAIKADGLALGKGVRIARSFNEARDAVHAMMGERIFGESGARVVIEEVLEGPEVSVLTFTDGRVVRPMISAMDHKRALDGDEGANTGGMGCIAPNPFYTAQVAEQCEREIFLPTIRALKEESPAYEFRGCLYFGLMLTQSGPRVIEYNCRFGDPEAQVVLPLLKTDLLDIMEATTDGRLADLPIEWSEKAACCVILASRGYPGHYETGFPITIDEDFSGELFPAGVRREGGELFTSGGRVCGVTCLGDCLASAIEECYRQVMKVHFTNATYRTDIGSRALAACDTLPRA